MPMLMPMPISELRRRKKKSADMPIGIGIVIGLGIEQPGVGFPIAIRLSEGGRFSCIEELVWLPIGFGMEDSESNACFGHEKLDVYRLELEFIAWLTDLLAEIRTQPNALVSEISNQIDRSSLSSLLNTAEGNSKRQARIRAKFFDDARGSAAESAACLDGMAAKRLCDGSRVRPGKQMLLRIVQMLSKLVDRYDSP